MAEEIENILEPVGLDFKYDDVQEVFNGHFSALFEEHMNELKMEVPQFSSDKDIVDFFC